MRVLFIIPDVQGRYFKPGQPHAGIAYLAGSISSNGHEVRVLDMRLGTERKKKNKILTTFHPDMIGITITTLQYKKTYGLIKDLKAEYPDITIIVGGAHVSILKGKALQETAADFAVFGEGENTLLETISAIEDGTADFSGIRGLAWRNQNALIENKARNPVKNLDTLPYPLYDIFPMKKYIDHKIPIVTSRGCPGQCVYCSVKTLFGRRFRARSPENVIEEITIWKKRGIKYFIFNDDCFTADIKRAEK